MKRLTQRHVVLLAAGVLIALAAAAAVVRGLRPASYGEFDYGGDASWKWSYMDMYARDPSFTLKFNDPHPTRGWTSKPDLVCDRFRRATTNNRGHRSLTDYAYHPEKYTVLVLGDSFTFGEGADDSEVWPTILQNMDAGQHVVNLAVSGYGLDQMYLTLRETIEEYKPQLVVMAYIEEDLTRSMMSFRDYRKPKFMVGENDELVLTNVPIGNERETFDLLQREYGRFNPKRILARENAAFRAWYDTDAYKQERFRLNTRIVEEALRCTTEHRATFFLVRLGWGGPITRDGDRPFLLDWGGEFGETFAANHDAAFLDTRRPMFESGRTWSPGHYGSPEAQFVAQLVYDRILQFPSREEFRRNHSQETALGNARGMPQ